MTLNSINWIKLPNEYESGYAVQDFIVGKINHSEITVCGLGFFKLYVNGKLVSMELNNPVWSNYEVRKLDSEKCSGHDEEFTYRYYFRTYDISGYLSKGVNRVGLILVNGWYRQILRQCEGDMRYGDCLKCAFIIRNSGRIITSTNNLTLVKPNHIVFSNIFFGEKHDYSLEDRKWCISGNYIGYAEGDKCQAPDSMCEEQKCPCDKVISTIIPKLIKDDGKIKIYDIGVNITGYAVVKADSDAVRVEYAEEYNPDGKYTFVSNPVEDGNGKIAVSHKSVDVSETGLNFMHTQEDQIQTDEYKNVGKGRLVRPEFAVYGFRYFSVAGGTAKCVKVVHSDLKRKATFKSNDQILNWEYDAYVRTQLNNMHSGVPSDCPHRERLGYTGDAQLTSECSMLSFFGEDFYRKWIQDVLDSQDKKTGHVPHTAPFYGGGGGPGGWGCAIVVSPYMHYQIYGDRLVLRDAFPRMLRWSECMDSFSENGLVVKEKEPGWCLGEWLTPAPLEIPADLVNTYYYAYSLKLMTKTASILREKEAKEMLQNKLNYVLNALKTKYVKHGEPSVHRQAAEAFLIDLGLCDADAVVKLNEYYEKSNTLDTGIFGTDVLFKVLCEHGYVKTVYDLLHSDGYPSFVNEMKSGSSTIWEGFDGTGSQDHPMYGSFVKYFYRYFAGLDYHRTGSGKFSIKLNPKVCKGMLPLTATLKTKDGYVKVVYADKDGRVSAEVTSKNVRISGKRIFDYSF